jgi:hypothetical protein
MKSILIILAFLLQAICLQLIGQQTAGIQGVTPPTPQAYAMTSFEAQQPSLYTGTANISIPLYNFNFEGMQIPLSLSYSAGGIRVNEEASEVGLGWSMNATAVISRTIEGKDDLFNGSNDIGYVHHTTAIQDVVFVSPYWNSLATGFIDTQPDIFNYNFFGHSGSFNLNKKENANDDITVNKLSSDNVKVSYLTDQSFTLTTPQGFIGLFSVKERSTTISTVTSTDNLSFLKNNTGYPDITSLKNSGQYRPVTSWYLKSLTAPNGKILNFDYAIDSDGNSQYVSITQPTFGEANVNSGQLPLFRTIQEHVYLTKIEIANEIKIDFNLENRDDLEKNTLVTLANNPDYITSSSYTPQRYSGIHIQGLLSFSTLDKTISFNQSYFHQEFFVYQGSNDNEFQWMRNRLDKVIIDDQVYRFQYEYGEKGLPNKSNFGIDNFGYFLKDLPNYSSLIRYDLRNFSATTPWTTTFSQTSNTQSILDNAKIGVLKKIYYPTGGYTEYEYELHDYYVQGSLLAEGAESINTNGDAGNAKGGGLRVKSVTSYSDKNIVATKKSYQYKLADPNRSSGLLMNPLWYFFYWEPTAYPGTFATKFISPSQMLSVNTAQGSKIGYSRVIEIFEGVNESFNKIYEFENIPTILQPNWQEYRVLGSQTYRNGRLALEVSKNSNDTEVETKQSFFNDDLINEVQGLRLILEQGSLFAHFRYKVQNIFSGVSQSVSVRKFSGTNLTTTTNYLYNNIKQLSSEETIGSNGEISKVTYRRPYDITSPSSAITAMKARNILEPTIEVFQEKNGDEVSAQGNQFELDASNLIVLRKTFLWNRDKGAFVGTSDGSTFGGGYELQNHFTKYDSQGRILEAVDKAGVYTSLLWGHNNTLPIVKGDGISHANLSAAFAASQGANFEADIRNHTNTADGFVSTYQHNPLVGVLEQGDPNSLNTSFVYDENYRLHHIKDDDGNVVQQYDYNFEQGADKSIVLTQSGIQFGTVAPNSSETKVFKVKNVGNDVIDITYVSFSNSYFASSWNDFPIAPGQTFNLPVTLNAPATNGGISSTVSLYQNPLNSADLTFNITASIDVPVREMSLPSTCALITTTFATTNVTIQNTGNDYLEVNSIQIESSDANDGIQLVLPSSGEWREGLYGPYELPLYIAPNSSGTFGVRFVNFSLGNWDNLTTLRIYSNSTNGYPSTYDATVLVKNNCN